jgi:alcohol dehydrogenase
MRAALMTAFREPLQVTTVADPAVPADGVVLEVLASGVCRSDWHGWQGHDPTLVLPHVPGHEMAGRVAALGPEVRAHAVGDLVTVPFCCGCGRCEQCLAGQTQVCDDEVQPGFTQWGSFAELVALPHADVNLVGLPADADPVAMAALGCRFMTAWAAAVEHGAVRPGQWVAVHGCGGLGLSLVMVATSLGAHVVAVDLDADRLAKARSLGAVATIDASAGGSADAAAAAVVEATAGGAHVSFDAVGSAGTAAASVLSLRKRGRHVQVGLMLATDRSAPMPMARVISYELSLVGVHGMAVGHYPALVAEVAAGRLDPGSLIGSRITLDDVPAELDAMTTFQQQGLSVVTSF